MSFDLNSCNQDCFDCIKSYKKKHRLSGAEENPFRISCSGIPKQYVSEDLYQILPEDQVKTAEIMLDPVAWAREVLDWHCFDPDGEIWKRKNPNEYHNWVKNHPGEDILGHSRYHRPYQAKILRCSSRQKIMRIGRQCLVGDTKVFLSDGTWKFIRDINAGDEVLSFVDNKMVPHIVTDQWSAGKKRILRIKTKFGHVIECTDNHRFLTIKNYIDRSRGITSENSSLEWSCISSGLQVGSKIGLSYSLPFCETEDDIKLAKLLGYFIADGSSSHRQSAKFTNINIDYLLEFQDLCSFFGTSVKWYKKGSGYDLIITNGRGKENPLRNLLKQLGLVGIIGPEKFIPDRIVNGSFKTIRAFLNTFWAADGYISTFNRTGRLTQRTEIGTLQESLKLITQIKEILWKFGIHGYIKSEANCYRLVISNKNSVKNFLEIIGPILGKEDACKIALKNIGTISDKYYHRTGDVLWDYISSIEEIGYRDTWDIEVRDSKNFVANGFVTHNSGKSEALVVAMLFHLFTKPDVPENEGFLVVVIAPYQAQIDLIFNRMDELLRSNVATQNSIASRTKSPPCRLILNNNSMVTGFTAGTKSGGNADSVRGQKANMLVMDEADYLNPKDLESALSIITNFPDATLWMSSTPKGTRDKFYQNCQSRLYKEFHFPSYVNPLWGPDLEAIFKEQLTEIGYKHEVEADFGEQEEGVFQNMYVEAAQSNFEYGQLPRNPNWRYMLGVDWNDVRIGTSITVIGFNPVEQVFYMMDKQRVSRDGWNQTAACHKIAQMNEFWRPEYIYVDSGGPAGGGTQVENLRQFGWQSLRSQGAGHPNSRLRDIVKPYAFGGSIEIHDLITKQPIKKPAKPFLVENTVRKFEHGIFRYPKSDELLTKQLLGYVVDHTTVSGLPVYKAVDETVGDHDLDAIMLALVAFTLETTDFGRPKFSIDFAFSGKIGEKIETEQEEIPGWVVVKSDKKIDPRKANRPSLTRTEGLEEEKKSLLSNTKSLPGSHLNRDMGGVKIWAWPGWDRDAPRPKAESSVRRGVHGVSVRVARPQRKNI
jgi:replicative DNA helicase